MNTILTVYIILINIAAFVVYGLDKKRAIAGEWRISEKVLLLLAAAGGSAGALLGMTSFRHKTQHMLFTIGVPVLLLIHIYLIFKYIAA